MIESKIIQLLETKLQEEEFNDFFVIEVVMKGERRLEVYMDGDEGISLGKCQQISRYLESKLDENLWLGESYTLEVSSPGVKRPLKFLRQYNKHVGRKLEVKTKEGEKFVGKLRELDTDKICLIWTERIKEGKKKRNIEIEKEIAFENIEKAIVKISFN